MERQQRRLEHAGQLEQRSNARCAGHATRSGTSVCNGQALPTARLPGAAGSGPTSGQYDTVILERPNANITVTLSSGTHNIRKLYMRETLNITGGSLTVNYNPAYRANDSADVLHGGPISAQFSGPVTLSGSGSLSVHTLQVDAARVFTLSRRHAHVQHHQPHAPQRYAGEDRSWAGT